MIVILSPAKRLNFNKTDREFDYSKPSFMEESNQVMNKLKKMNTRGLMKLMDINENLAETNYERYQNWNMDFTTGNTKPAILAFKGDVFLGMDPESYSREDFEFSQEHLRILSGLHGVLKPLDLIKPYRLEMGTSLKVGRSKNLYEFWKKKITSSIVNSNAYQSDKTIINLASKEYFNAIDTSSVKGKVIEPAFKEYRNGSYRPIHIFLKKARGMMASFIVKNKIQDVEKIKLFDREGYEFNDKLSDEFSWVFTRG